MNVVFCIKPLCFPYWEACVSHSHESAGFIHLYMADCMSFWCDSFINRYNIKMFVNLFGKKIRIYSMLDMNPVQTTDQQLWPLNMLKGIR
jgi:hypothetical protein